MTHRLLNEEDLLYVFGSRLLAVYLLRLIRLFTIAKLIRPLIALCAIPTSVVGLSRDTVAPVHKTCLSAQDLTRIDCITGNIARHPIPRRCLPAQHIVFLNTISVWIHSLLPHKRIEILLENAIAVCDKPWVFVSLSLVAGHRHLEIGISMDLHRPTQTALTHGLPVRFLPTVHQLTKEAASTRVTVLPWQVVVMHSGSLGVLEQMGC